MMTNKQTPKNRKGEVKQSVQSQLPLGEIRENLVVLKEGGIRAIVKTSSVNFNLKSEAEQESTIVAYQHFLNSLEFPVQIVIRSRKLNLDEYLDKINKRAFDQQNEILRKQTQEYYDYIKKLIEVADIMQKNFYVVIPQDPVRVASKGVVQSFFDSMSSEDSLQKVKQRYNEFKSLKDKIENRVDLVQTGLERCGLRVQRLQTQDLIELYYRIYNPESAYNHKLHHMSEYNILG